MNVGVFVCCSCMYWVRVSVSTEGKCPVWFPTWENLDSTVPPTTILLTLVRPPQINCADLLCFDWLTNCSVLHSDGGGVWGVWGSDGQTCEGCSGQELWERLSDRAERRHKPPPVPVAAHRGGKKQAHPNSLHLLSFYSILNKRLVQDDLDFTWTWFQTESQSILFC